MLAFAAAVVSVSASRPSRVALRLRPQNLAVADTNEPDTNQLKYPFDANEQGGLYGKDPSNIKEEVEFDPTTGNYLLYRKIGNLEAQPPMIMTPEEYQEYIAKKQVEDYWKAKTQSKEAAKAEGRDADNGLIPSITVNNELFERIFGGNTIDIKPQGYAELRFGGRQQRIDNPIIPERNRSTFTFDFDQRIQMNVNGSVGENLNLGINYDTEATFAFENQIKTEFTGQEDDIVKKFELGNVSLPLNSSLINGAQSLFGAKGQFQFGKLMVTGVFSEQRSQSSSVNIQGGATSTEFEIWGDQYEPNKHYFLAHYFRDNYENFLRNAPLITSPVQITKIEVWVTNTRQNTQDTRNIIAFADLGERRSRAYRVNRPTGPDIFAGGTNRELPDNRVNLLDPNDLQRNYSGIRDITQVVQTLNANGFEEATEFTDLANARKLNPSEYTFDPQLGYISLNTQLNQDEVLAVAFQYTAQGGTYQVGEFSTDGVTPPDNLVVKMLKSTILDVRIPMWDLMMKNVYALGAFQVGAENFRLQVLYRNDETGTPIPFLPESNLRNELLLRVMNLDKLNQNNDPQPDGFFDFIPGITIRPQNGRIIFPVLEPFGSNLANKLETEEMREEYVFNELYDSTLFVAQNETRLNKFLLKGEFSSSSSSEIQLNAFNIPQGSVSVTAGGTRLVEGSDYKVDYNLGRVTILNDGILNSGVPIRVDFENNALFNFQTKTFAGINADYRFNENANLGATMVHLNERPLTQKVNLGDEPISNTIVGLNGSFTQDAPYLTRFVDNIPFIDTKEKSNILVQGEVARIIPGSPDGIEINGEATTFLDDFESSQTTIDIRNPNAWRLASTPAGQPDLFPETDLNSLAYGFNRARLAWYTIDPLFHRSEARTPDNIRNNPILQSTNDVRQVTLTEVFPNLDADPSQPQNIPTLDLAFFPRERGPYNFDVEPTAVSAGITEQGALRNPQSRWGGIMRDVTSTNFEQQNIEFIQIWMLNPFEGNPNAPIDGGDLYINLGSVSEDILRDGQQAVENTIPVSGNVDRLDTTRWGLASRTRPPVVAFDNDPAARDVQDVGYDLLNDDQEQNWPGDTVYGNYLQRIAAAFGTASAAYQAAQIDPASDNFQYYRGDELDNQNANILQRYKRWNNPDGNSDPSTVAGVTAFATNLPDIEDINRDQTLSKTETYYQYKISIRPQDLRTEGQNYITSIHEPLASQINEQPDGTKPEPKWIQFKIPVFDPDSKVGPIGDFRSIRFVRMYMKGFAEPIVLRMARMEFVRGEWRRYQFSLDGTRDRLSQDDQENTIFEVNAVNIEQNGTRDPVPYVVPPGIDRQIIFGTTAANQQNEQSLSLRILNLEDGDARAVFRNIDFDMRLYKKLRMFVHAEDGFSDPPSGLQDDDLDVFIRLGADYDQNYYEYAIPMKVTPVNQGVGQDDRDLIWPAENEFNFELNVLKDAKLERDRAYRQSGNGINVPYEVPRGNGRVTVVGQPNLGNVRTVMIGVRNPKRRLLNDGDDGLPKSTEVWVNELRLTEFDQQGGWAANARVAAKLADFANVTVSGRTSTIGWGSLDQSVSEFQQEEMYAYDLQSNFELGKFFNKKSGLRIPMFYSTSEQWINPRFNPLDPDIEFDRSLENIDDANSRDSLRKASQDYTRRTSLNFTNVRKTRTGKRAQKTPMPWDVENLSATYSFNEIFRRNINTVFDRTVRHSGNVNYTYRTNPKPVEPFKKVDWLKSDYLALIRDFNFFYYPNSFSAIVNFDRSFNSMQMRNTDALLSDIPPEFLGTLEPTYNKNFTLNRQYSLLFDLTKNLRFDFNARLAARIDEFPGAPEVDSNRAFVQENLMELGRPTNYHQTSSLTWQVPVNKLPLMDFANVTASYTADYDWQAQSLTGTGGIGGGQPLDSTLNFGNIIQNNRQIQLNNTFNFNALYNKVPYFKKALNPNQGRNNRRRRPEVLRRGLESSEQGQKDEEDEEEDEPTVFDKILRQTTRILLMTKSGAVNYTQSNGVILPGFEPNPNLVGMSTAGNSYAPGFAFTMGQQSDNFRRNAADNGWLVRNSLLNNQYSETENINLTYRLTAEPIKSLRIVINAQRNQTNSLNEFFRFNDSLGDWESQNSFANQTFSMSYNMINTAFDGGFEAPDYNSPVYNAFRENRLVISQRLAEEASRTDSVSGFSDPNYTVELVGSPDSANYGYRYYSVTSQEVLIPAFLAAYSGINPENVALGATRSTPLPNWQINYDGLSRIKFFKKYFNSFVLNHSYRSTYTIGNSSTNLLRSRAVQDLPPGTIPVDNNGDVLPVNQITNLSLSEQFAPLIGFNTKLKNNTTIRLEYKQDRNINLSLANNQITETNGKEWVIGAGYIIQNLKLKFIKVGARRTSPVSNLELRADIGIRDNVTLIRRIVEDETQATAGQTITTVKISADYQISQRVQTKLFYDLNRSTFRVSNAFPLTTHQFGISVRLNLGR
jgi:cell surface protein SprA